MKNSEVVQILNKASFNRKITEALAKFSIAIVNDSDTFIKPIKPTINRQQIKPVVIGYRNTFYAGDNCNDDSKTYNLGECRVISDNDRYIRARESNNITKKCKFRPVYQK